MLFGLPLAFGDTTPDLFELQASTNRKTETRVAAASVRYRTFIGRLLCAVGEFTWRPIRAIYFRFDNAPGILKGYEFGEISAQVFAIVRLWWPEKRQEVCCGRSFCAFRRRCD